MPRQPARACRAPGCAALVRPPRARCDRHEREHHARIDAQRGSPASRGYGPEWRLIRAEHLARNPRCVMADGTCAGPLHVDHIKPLSLGGTHEPTNLRTLCQSHHNARTAREQAFGRGAA